MTVVGIWIALGTPLVLLGFLLAMERIESRFVQEDPEPVRIATAHRRVRRNLVKKSTASSPSSVHG